MMVGSYPWWWLALPVLLLPVWWHRQKRQRLKAEPLATARFLPSAPPEQLRVWQWRDKILLLLRCLMLIALIAWLAAAIFPWRGDTVLVDAGAERAWTEQQIAAAGFSTATRMPLPPDVLTWLRQHERDWRADARLLVVSRASQIAMPARPPQFSHQVELRTNASPSAAPEPPHAAVSTEPATRGIALAAQAAREPAWRSLFAAFDSVGSHANRYVLTAEPSAGTTLIVWDMPDAAPPEGWRAPHWWIATPDASKHATGSGRAPSRHEAASPSAAFPELASASTLTINGITLRYADSPRGRLWTSEVFPPRDADTAHALYEAWQMLATTPAPAYATPSHTFAAARSPLPAIANARAETWLGIALLALFTLERILTHARRN